MKKTLIALTALVAATVGFQTQAEAGHRHNGSSGVQFGVQLGNGTGFSIGNGFRRVHQTNRYSGRRYGNRYRYRCNLVGKRAIKRSLRYRGFYNIRRVRRSGQIYSAKAVSPRGYWVSMRINGCNNRILNRRILKRYTTTWARDYYGRNYW
jgi:hypothetical protein